MKKLLALLLALVLVVALCACGQTETPVESDDSGDLKAEDLAPAAADASGADTYVLTDDMKNAGDGSLNEEKYQLALDCVGETVDVLYDTIGEPEAEPHYAASCLEMGAEDGQLYYDSDGFYVTTLKNADGETVMGVVTYGG